MKKFGTVLTALVMLCSSFAFAADSIEEKVSAKVKAAFTTDFVSASDVSWEKTSEFYFVNFTMHNVQVTAAYNEQGELVGTSRSIDLSQLPLNVSLAIAKKYEGYKMPEKALELSYDGETRYYVNVENDAQVLKLKCSSSGSIEVDKKIRKK